MPLPTVVLAHQHGMGLSSYKRQQPQRMAIKLDGILYKYELRGEREITRTGALVTVWSAWRALDVPAPFRVYDVQASSRPAVVETDLEAWLAGI